MSVYNQKVVTAISKLHNLRNNYVKESTKAGKRIVGRIMPSPFIKDKLIIKYTVYDEHIKREINKEKIIDYEYSLIENSFSAISQRLSLSGFRILNLIPGIILFNENYIYLPIDIVVKFYDTDRKSVIKGFGELIQNKVLAKTNRKSVYIVNHNIIYKGSKTDFENDYNKIFNIHDINEFLDETTNKVIIDEFNVEERKQKLLEQLHKISNKDYSSILEDNVKEAI